MDNSWHIFLEYLKIINEYMFHYKKSAKYNNHEKDQSYLFLNGINVLTHIFKLVLHQTNKPIAALENMQSSIYYYTQFIDQMDENIMYDLNVSSNSASLFLYKKAVENISEHSLDIPIQRDVAINLSNLITIYKSLIELYTITEEALNKKLNSLMQELTLKITTEQELQSILERVILFINNNNKYEYIQHYIKKYKHQPFTLQLFFEKKSAYEYEKIFNSNDADKYIKWLLNL
jgi:hypothetical protein